MQARIGERDHGEKSQSLMIDRKRQIGRIYDDQCPCLTDVMNDSRVSSSPGRKVSAADPKRVGSSAHAVRRFWSDFTDIGNSKARQVTGRFIQPRF